MGRRLSGWLVLARLFQILGSFIPGAMNGWLLYYIATNKLGPSKLMLVLEILVAVSFLYASLSLLILHTRRRSRRTAYMACSVVCDVIFCFVDIAIVSLLSFTGLPSNCSGFTISVWTKGDKADLPSRGYTTIRFSNEQDGHRGQLDKFCGLERGFFFCSVLVILAYIITIILSVFRICDLNCTRNSEIQHLLDERDEILKLELKLQEQEIQPQPRSPVPVSRPPVVAPPVRVAPEDEAALFASMRRPAPMPSSSNFNMPSSSTFMSAGLPSIPEASSSSSASAGPTSSIPVESALLLSSTELHANLAMISDGSRYSGNQLQADNNQLPPYSPGNRRTMHGHGDETNEIRLSEYVKGETRAQDMKDGGGYQ